MADSTDLTYGEVDWNDPVERGGRTEFLKLEKGNTTVRVMGQPVKYHLNWIETPDKKRKKINTPIEDSALVDRLEEAGFKREQKWILKILDRSDDTFKLLEVGTQIFSGIRDLVKNPKWGKVTNYDISIARGAPGTQPLYKVVPEPKEPLPKELQASWEKFNNSLNIERLIAPSDPEYVYGIMGWSPSGSTTKAGASNTSRASAEASSEEFEFED